MNEKLYTTAKVAAELGIEPVTVRWLAAKHGIGQKFGPNWLFTAADVERLRDRPAQGRPPVSATQKVSRAADEPQA